MLHLHHLQNSRSFRILWLLEELNLEYQLTNYERTASYLAPDILESIHPMGKAPILEVDGTPMIESGHIIDYLMVKYDADYQLHPKIDADSKEWLNYDFWLHFAEGSVMPPLLMRLVFAKVVEKSPVFIKPISRGLQKQVESTMINKNVEKVFNLMEKHLQSNQWFSGENFSAVDINMHFIISASHSRQPFSKAQYANLLNWLARCESRPAFTKAVNKGGKLEF